MFNFFDALMTFLTIVTALLPLFRDVTTKKDQAPTKGFIKRVTGAGWLTLTAAIMALGSLYIKDRLQDAQYVATQHMNEQNLTNAQKHFDTELEKAVDSMQKKIDSISPTMVGMNVTIANLTRSVAILSSDTAGFGLFLNRLKAEHHIIDSNGRPRIIENLVSTTEYRGLKPTVEVKVRANLIDLLKRFPHPPEIVMINNGPNGIDNRVISDLATLLRSAQFRESIMEGFPSGETDAQVVIVADPKDSAFIYRLVAALHPYIRFDWKSRYLPIIGSSFVKIQFYGFPHFDGNGAITLQ